MGKAALLWRIGVVQSQLGIAKEKKAHAEKEKKEVESLIGSLQKKRGEMENGMNTTIANMDSRLARLSSGTAFARHMKERVRNIVMNDSAMEAIQATVDGEAKARNRALALEDDIAGYQRQIDNLRWELQQLNDQLSVEEEE